MSGLNFQNEKARPAQRRRAFSFVELTAVVAILGVVALISVGRFASGTLQNCAAEGYARQIAVDMLQARRRTISTGDNHYLSLTESGGAVTSYVMWRRASGGDAIVDATKTTPFGVTVTASSSTLEFDFDGASLAAYMVTVAGPNRTWTITTTIATGAVATTVSP